MKLFLKGLLIGIGKIIPGISGSAIAMIIGLYDRLLISISKPFVKDNFLFLIKVLSGIIFSIALFSKVIIFSLNWNYFVVMLFFIGLISGSIISLYKSVDKTGFFFEFITFFIGISFMLFNSSYNKTIDNVFTSFWLGMIESFTTIIPGISGTAIFVILGYYEGVLHNFGQLFNISSFMSNIRFFVPFFMGFSLCTFFLAKVINYLLKKYSTYTIHCIIGFILSSIVLLLIEVFSKPFNLIQFVFGFILLVVGFIISNCFK